MDAGGLLSAQRAALMAKPFPLPRPPTFKCKASRQVEKAPWPKRGAVNSFAQLHRSICRVSSHDAVGVRGSWIKGNCCTQAAPYEAAWELRARSMRMRPGNTAAGSGKCRQSGRPLTACLGC